MVARNPLQPTGPTSDRERAQVQYQEEQAAKRKAEAERAAAKAKKKKEKAAAKKLDAETVTQDELTVVTDEQGRTYLTQPTKEGAAEPYFALYDEATGQVNITTNFTEVRKRLLDDYVKRDGDLEGLRRDLYNKGYIRKDAYESKDNGALSAAIYSTISQYGVDQQDAVNLGMQSNFSSFSSWLGSLKGVATGGPKTQVDRRITTRGDADEEINTYFFNYFGRAATKKEREQYFADLNKAERSASRVTTATETSATETGSLIDENDKFFIFGKIAAPAAKGTNIEKLLKGGGKVAEDIMDVKQFAASNGIRLTDDEARNYINSTLTKRGMTIDTIKTKIRATSQSLYSNLDLTATDVEDLGRQFARQKEEMLELTPGSVSIFDKDVQAALTNGGNKGVMSLSNFNVAMKNKTEYRYTQGAREEAAKYATTILESFGLA